MEQAGSGMPVRSEVLLHLQRAVDLTPAGDPSRSARTAALQAAQRRRP